MNQAYGLLVIWVPILTAVLLYMLWMNKQSKKWKLETEGEYDHAVYGEKEAKRRTGAMVHTTHTYIIERTVVFFTDGRTCVLRGWIDMAYPKGTKLKIYKNPLGNRHIDWVGRRGLS